MRCITRSLVFIGFLFVLGLAFGLAGCATPMGFDQMMQSLVGLPFEEVLMEIGPPHSTYNTDDGGKVVGYSFFRESKMTVNLGNTGYWRTGRPHLVNCRFFFRVNADGVITSYGFSGTGCKAKELKEKQ